MPSLGDERDGDFALRRVPGRFYISRRFPEGGSETGATGARICRFAYKVIDEEGELIFESENGWEIVLRETPTRQQLKALFFEDTREVATLSFQRFNASGDRLKSDSFLLRGDEVQGLSAFLALIRSQSLDLVESDGLRLLPEGIDALLADEQYRQAMFRRYRDAFAELFEADVDAPEVVAYARRRTQLEVFRNLLDDDEALERRRAELERLGRRSGVEDVWQDFFESNHWIFGTGLAPQFLHAWDPSRLEQTVVGSSIFTTGKRPDGVMRTAGALSALVLVEIKTHRSPLMAHSEYRPGTWRVTNEVSGGVAQCQRTVDDVVRYAERELDITDDDGFGTSDRAFVCRPRSILVVGRLDEFVRDGEPHRPKYESFERFRRSLQDPEIVTFDELYERAAMTLALSRRDQSNDRAGVTDDPGDERSDSNDDVPF